MTQKPCAGVRLLLIQTALSRLTLFGTKIVAALSKTYAVKLTAKFARCHGLMTHLTWILRTKILTQCADASKKDNLLLTLLLTPRAHLGQSLKMDWKRSSTCYLQTTLEHLLKLITMNCHTAQNRKCTWRNLALPTLHHSTSQTFSVESLSTMLT
jgi:hypothetical protein